MLQTPSTAAEANSEGVRDSRPVPATVAAGWAVALAAVATIALASVLQRALDLDAAFFASTLLLAGAGGGLVVVLAARHRVAESFGLANAATLARGGAVVLLFALAGSAAAPATGWLVVAIALLGLILDGIDGRIARRRGEVSEFGARFDMETDALLILGLSVLAWQLGKAGPWILAAGALRYAFVAAGYLFEWLRRPLPYSRRRQTACVVQIVSLMACVLPPIMAPASAVVGLAGLLVLVASFAVDVAWLSRRATE
jgi:phosphatidylglycerophosphate synthase